MLSVYGTERIQVGTEPVADNLLHNWGDDKQDLLSRAITEEEVHQSCHYTTKSASLLYTILTNRNVKKKKPNIL